MGISFLVVWICAELFDCVHGTSGRPAARRCPQKRQANVLCGNRLLAPTMRVAPSRERGADDAPVPLAVGLDLGMAF